MIWFFYKHAAPKRRSMPHGATPFSKSLLVLFISAIRDICVVISGSDIFSMTDGVARGATPFKRSDGRDTRPSDKNICYSINQHELSGIIRELLLN
jgi:hypothetical protein